MQTNFHSTEVWRKMLQDDPALVIQAFNQAYRLNYDTNGIATRRGSVDPLTVVAIIEAADGDLKRLDVETPQHTSDLSELFDNNIILPRDAVDPTHEFEVLYAAVARHSPKDYFLLCASFKTPKILMWAIDKHPEVFRQPPSDEYEATHWNPLYILSDTYDYAWEKLSEGEAEDLLERFLGLGVSEYESGKLPEPVPPLVMRAATNAAYPVASAILHRFGKERLDTDECDGKTAIHRAILIDRFGTRFHHFANILKLGADPYRKDANGKTALDLAAEAFNTKYLSILLNQVQYDVDALRAASQNASDLNKALLQAELARKTLDESHPQAKLRPL